MGDRPLSAPQQVEPKPAKSLLEKLNKQRINLHKTTGYVLATINVGQEKPAYTFVEDPDGYQIELIGKKS